MTTTLAGVSRTVIGNRDVLDGRASSIGAAVPVIST
jgi:hypothetical protein